MKRLFTSESVTEGHPDKICDQISDGVLDAIFEQDAHAHVACESFCTTGTVVIMGEISTSCYVDIEKIARNVICDIGYDCAEAGFNGHTCGILTSIHEQSGDIAMGVSKSFDSKADDELANLQGAGDQGIMFGYACNETDEYMPLATMLAHKICRRLSEVRKNGTFDYLRPDGKSQVTVEYDKSGKPYRIDAVVLSTQHSESISLDVLRKDMIEKVIKAVIPDELLDDETKYFINPTGRFVIGGPEGDTGLTGRKVIVDTYGGAARHGGGAFSGKDPSKVDRSAAYALRHIAKNIVAAGLADKCEIQAAYAIGVANPVSVTVDTFGTGKYSNEKIEEAVLKVFDLRPYSIIKDLDLLRPIYRKTAAYGHFGRSDADFTWEKLDKIEELKAAVNA